MAGRKAAKVLTWKPGKTLPEGVSIQTIQRTIPVGGEVKDGEDTTAKFPIQVCRVEANGAAVSAAIAWLSEKGPGDEHGIAQAAAGLNACFADVVSTGRLTGLTIGESLTILPNMTAPKVVDPFEVATTKAATIRKAGGDLTKAMLLEMFADVLDG